MTNKETNKIYNAVITICKASNLTDNHAMMLLHDIYDRIKQYKNIEREMEA